MTLVDVIRKARKESRTSMNKIEAVTLVRKLTGRGLKEAKDFFDWIDLDGDGLSAPKLAGHWCEGHWQDNEICGCPLQQVEPEKPEIEMAAKTNRSSPARRESEPEMSEADAPDQQQHVQPFNCKCGNRECRNEWHSLAMWMEQDLIKNYRILLACAEAQVNVLHDDQEPA